MTQMLYTVSYNPVTVKLKGTSMKLYGQPLKDKKQEPSDVDIVFPILAFAPLFTCKQIFSISTHP